MYDIKNHRIEDIWYRFTSNYSRGKTITPKFVTLHYTTGWSATANRDWLLGNNGGRPASNASAHIVIGREGEVWQICPFNKRAWHAGPSSHGELDDINTHSVGIEFVNPGWLKPSGDGKYYDYFNRVMTEAELNDEGGFILEPHPRVGAGTYAWPRYTDTQMEEGIKLVASLIKKYDILDIVSHEEIDKRGWKTDPGPAFPFAHFVDLLPESLQSHVNRKYRVIPGRLYIRGGPGQEFEPVDPPRTLTQDTRVRLLDVEGKWFFVTLEDDSTVTGWVHSRYLSRIWE